jgi:hypothetical protein
MEDEAGGAKMVWTIHDLRSHESKSEAMDKRAGRLLAEWVDHCIVHSLWALEAICARCKTEKLPQVTMTLPFRVKAGQVPSPNEALVRNYVQSHDMQVGMHNFLKLAREAVPLVLKTLLYLMNYPLHLVRSMKRG